MMLDVNLGEKGENGGEKGRGRAGTTGVVECGGEWRLTHPSQSRPYGKTFDPRPSTAPADNDWAVARQSYVSLGASSVSSLSAGRASKPRLSGSSFGAVQAGG